MANDIGWLNRVILPRRFAAVAAPISKPPFDRKRYQRDYMRTYLPKWRAKRAQAKSGLR